MKEAIFDHDAIRARLQHASGLKTTPPQDYATAGMATPVAPVMDEGWHVYWNPNSLAEQTRRRVAEADRQAALGMFCARCGECAKDKGDSLCTGSRCDWRPRP